MPEYDYGTPGFYFVTISTKDKKNLFGEIKDGMMSLNETGIVVAGEWEKTPGTSIWHRNYYEHVIRSEESLFNIRSYIICNPVCWEDDNYFKK